MLKLRIIHPSTYMAQRCLTSKSPLLLLLSFPAFLNADNNRAILELLSIFHCCCISFWFCLIIYCMKVSTTRIVSSSNTSLFFCLTGLWPTSLTELSSVLLHQLMPYLGFRIHHWSGQPSPSLLGVSARSYSQLNMRAVSVASLSFHSAWPPSLPVDLSSRNKETTACRREQPQELQAGQKRSKVTAAKEDSKLVKL